MWERALEGGRGVGKCEREHGREGGRVKCGREHWREGGE